MERREYDATVLDLLLKRLKSNLRITSEDLDEELEHKLRAAIAYAEHQISQVIVPSLFTVTEELGDRGIELRSPLVSVDSVKSDDKDLVYTLNGVTLSPAVKKGSNVSVSYKAGMAEIPEDIVFAICIKASSMFQHPMDSVEVLNNASAKYLASYRNYPDGRS